jgi:hypothetical protein
MVYRIGIYNYLLIYNKGGDKMNWFESDNREEDIYSDDIEELVDNDQLTTGELGFMTGYNSA